MTKIDYQKLGQIACEHADVHVALAKYHEALKTRKTTPTQTDWDNPDPTERAYNSADLPLANAKVDLVKALNATGVNHILEAPLDDAEQLAKTIKNMPPTLQNIEEQINGIGAILEKPRVAFATPQVTIDTAARGQPEQLELWFGGKDGEMGRG